MSLGNVNHEKKVHNYITPLLRALFIFVKVKTIKNN